MSRYGAVDIGSNSVRMLAAEVIPGQPLQIVAEDREVTRLGSPVFRDGSISPDAIDLTCAVLARMAQALGKLNLMAVRAVATSALRDARNQEEFLQRARLALGVPVEVISGEEEARLIHLGVQARWPHPDEDVLIIDVGGGSAEFILGCRAQLAEAFSKPVGAVRLTEMFLKNDPPTSLELHQMQEYIREKLAPAVERIGKGGLGRTVATAATAAALVRAVHGIPRSKRDQADRMPASRTDLEQLLSKLSRRPLAQRRKITGIGPRRAELIIAGCSVLHLALEEFERPELYYSLAGVRDGVVADLAQRGVGWETVHLDAEQRRTVRALARRYGAPLTHVDKVAAIARGLFESLRPLHRLQPPTGRLLEAASYLHDVGHFISDTRHHKHSFYIVANSDLPGFTERERLVIANLCRYHRKALPSPGHENYKLLDEEERTLVNSLIPLLRLADSLDLGREQRVRTTRVEVRNGSVELYLDSPENIDLEQWAAQQVSSVFKQIYGQPLAVFKSAKR